VKCADLEFGKPITEPGPSGCDSNSGVARGLAFKISPRDSEANILGGGKSGRGVWLRGRCEFEGK
jgi:hypothetical protein